MQKTKTKLILEDGTELIGDSFGAKTESSGEVVFNTGMVGYPESLTDLSYNGQILVLTYPLVGNYGIPNDKLDKNKISEFFESDKIQIKGLVVSEYSEKFNHFEAKKSLGDWLKEYNIPGLTGIDTRALTQKLREKGTMLGQLRSLQSKRSNNCLSSKAYFYDPNKENLVADVSIKKPITYKNGKKTIVILDCGMKLQILRNFLKRDVTVIRVPWNYDIFKNKIKFDGLFISNGPGDPRIVKDTQNTVKEALNRKIPTFGICLGNQIMGLAAGAEIYKLKYGHRSQNQPVMDVETEKCLITSQNHGFAIKNNTLPDDWQVYFKNLNDNTIEGIKHKKLPFFAVQFHPEATPGPIDSNYLFDKFINNL